MSYRQKNLAALRELGFRVADSLPALRSEEVTLLRPIEEIVGRAVALRLLCLWVSAPVDKIPSVAIETRLSEDMLHRWLTQSELQILKLSRTEAQSEHINTIGWRLENLWPLAWILGFDREPQIGGMIGDAVLRTLVPFFGSVGNSVASIAKAAKVRAVSEVECLEDLFYCAHNAAVSARLGGTTVPPDFDPLVDGGIVHERRHALTWALSPGVDWDETDLST